MKKHICEKILVITFLTILKFIFVANLSAQERFWVFFTDKNGVTFNPYDYFDEKAIQRRLIHNISLYDSTDFPINKSYVEAVSLYVDSVSKHSRWFNAIVVYAPVEQVNLLMTLSFVKDVMPIYSQAVLASVNDDSIFFTDSLDLSNQLKNMGGEYFLRNNITGKGVRIAVFDAGFPEVDSHQAFEHLRKNNRIVKTWDFVRNRENVYRHSSHGTSVLSCISGYKNNTLLGLATDAEFLLARTEMSIREPFSEEENWLAAAEWADKNGAHIINSSLGYTYHRYFYEDMDGNTSLVSRAANMAAKKGILVVNAAGNEGTSSWKYIGAPADADSVLSVGGVSPQDKPVTSIQYGGSYENLKINFSSFGPTYDKRMKPNVCAYGRAMVAKKDGFNFASGTSFSAPLVTGFAACVLEMFPHMSNMELFKAIEQSGDLFPYFDYAHGYGVPQAEFFINQMQKNVFPKSFDLIVEEDFLRIVIADVIEPNADVKNLLYYNIQNEDGVLHKYFVVSVHSKEVARVYFSDISKGQKLNVFYNGFFNSFTFK